MEINFTNMIEKTLKDLIKGNRGEQAARLYRKYWNPINFAIVGAVGLLIYFLIGGAFQNLFGWFGNTLSLAITWFWIWVNSVGPYGYLWGFKKKEKKQE